ncbi:MAG: hypothetical protein J7480_10120 [Microbacteriaceae bacterium]|nr:hypothetical protein [Microbacteriaceae bacterium]
MTAAARGPDPASSSADPVAVLVGAAAWAFAGMALVAHLTPWLGAWLPIGAWVALAGAAGAAGVLLTRPARIRIPTAAWLALVPTAAVAVAGSVATWARGAAGLAWATHNDAAWTLMQTRAVIEDAGVDPAAPVNAAPLTSIWLAPFVQLGRLSTPLEERLHGDLAWQAQGWLVLMLLVSVVVAAIAWCMLSAARRTGARAVLAAVGSLVPWGAYFAGHAMSTGWVNASVGLLLLALAWLAWLRARLGDPRTVLIALSGTATAMLAAWAPLALVPAALAAGVAWQERRRLRSDTGIARIVLLALVPAGYAALVLLPAQLRVPRALANEGGAILVPWWGSAAVAALAVLLAIALRSGPLLVGTSLVVGSGAAVVGALVLNRIGAGAAAWGYYPAKAQWLLTGMLALIVLFEGVALLIRLADRHPRAAAPLRLGGLVLLGSATWCTGLLLTPFSAWSYPPVDLVAQTGANRDPAIPETIVRLGAGDGRGLAAQLLGRSRDLEVDIWLVEQLAQAGDDPERILALMSGFHPDDSSAICRIANALGGGITVTTAVPVVADQLAKCTGVRDVRLAG